VLPESHESTGLLASPTLTNLTSRETEVLCLVADGLSDKEVAARLGMRTRTVGNHLQSIYSKLQVNSRTAAARFVSDGSLVRRRAVAAVVAAPGADRSA
jgi:DNA-binding NarL/FixJ family response regulator